MQNNTNRWLSILFLLFAVLCGYGQGVQQGRIKTLGRPGKPGTGLPGVLVSVTDVSNDMISNQNGMFSFSPKGKKYMVSRIRKNNYQLIDQSVIGRMFPFSSEVPVEFVMVSRQDLQNDRQRIEDKAYERAEKNYKRQIDELNKKLKSHVVTQNEAQKLRIRIGENYQRYLNLIGEMAERYATIDYDGISDTNRLIMESIENGDILLADSLLNTKGSFLEREAELNAQRIITEEAEAFVQKSKKALKVKLEDLAQDYYNKHSILLNSYQNDSAAFFLERRALLDTTRVEWMLQAGMFINNYLADYKRALGHYQHARSISTTLFGKESLQVALCNNLIGKSMAEQGKYSKAMNFFTEAQMIFEALPSQNTAALIECYSNMASIFLKIERAPYLNAQVAMKHAKALTLELYGEQSAEYAKVLMMDAEISVKMGYASSAVKDLYRVQEMYKGQIGNSLVDNAWNSYRLGVALLKTHEFAKGRNHILEALQSWKNMFGEYHPYLAYAYGALGDSYMEEKSYPQADSCYIQALRTQRSIFGELHPYISECDKKLGLLYRRQGKYAEASRYGLEALNVLLQFDEYNVNEVIGLLQNIDSWLSILSVGKHSDIELKELYQELRHLNALYEKTANKKIILKKVKL